jgi:methyl-accepting chemotaxis protein
MTVPVAIERKVKQLDNDVQSIYEMLADIAATQRRQANRLTEMDDKLSETHSKVTEMDATLTETRSKLTEMDGTLTEMDGTLTETRGKVTEMDSKLDTILGLLRGDRPD